MDQNILKKSNLRLAGQSKVLWWYTDNKFSHQYTIPDICFIGHLEATVERPKEIWYSVCRKGHYVLTFLSNVGLCLGCRKTLHKLRSNKKYAYINFDLTHSLLQFSSVLVLLVPICAKQSREVRICSIFVFSWWKGGNSRLLDDR